MHFMVTVRIYIEPYTDTSFYNIALLTTTATPKVNQHCGESDRHHCA